MPRIFYLLFISCLCTGIAGANKLSDTDSFNTGNNRTNLHDSVDYLLHLTLASIESYPAKAFLLATKAKQISEQNKWVEKTEETHHSVEHSFFFEELHEDHNHYYKLNNTYNPEYGNN